MTSPTLLSLTEKLYFALEDLPDHSKASSKKNKKVQEIASEIIFSQNLIVPADKIEWVQVHQNLALSIDRFKTINKNGGFISGRWFNHKSFTRTLAIQSIQKVSNIQKNLFYQEYLGNQYQILLDLQFSSTNLSNLIHCHQRSPKLKTPVKWNKKTLSLPRSMIITPKGKMYLLYTSKEDPVIGKGSFKTVRSCIEINTGAKKAIAIIKKTNILNHCTSTAANLQELYWHRVIQLAQNEANSMGFWEGDSHIVQLDLYYEFGNKCYFIMEYCEIGNLKELLLKNLPISKEVIALNLSAGLVKIHQQGYLHRDIKAENIFLTQSNDKVLVKYGDLGFMSKILEPFNDQVGTPMYMAPELIEPLDNCYPYSEKTDIWALGCVFFEIFVGPVPSYLNEYSTKTIRDIIENTPLKRWEKILLHGMLQRNLSARWDSNEVFYYIQRCITTHLCI